MTDLSVIVVNWNTRDILAECMRSIHQGVPDLDVDVIVVDNGSVDGSVQLMRENYPTVWVIANPDNVGFARANNQGLALGKGRYVLLLNSDTEVLPGSLDAAVHFMDGHPQAGIAGVRLLNRDRTFQASYTPFPTLWSEFLVLSTLGRRVNRPTYPSYGPRLAEGPQRVDGYVQGACLLARRQAVDEVGTLDERIFMYAEEVDWCYRFHRAGWEIWYLPQAPIIHHGGQSTGKRRGRMEAELYRSRVYFFRKHYGAAVAHSLKMLIYAMTLIKMLMHGALKFASGGRAGRAVTSWQELRQTLSSVNSGSKGQRAP